MCCVLVGYSHQSECQKKKRPLGSNNPPPFFGGGLCCSSSTFHTHTRQVKEVEDSSSISSQEDSDEPFELKVDEYPVPLQMVYHMLLRNTEVVDPDMRQAASVSPDQYSL